MRIATELNQTFQTAFTAVAATQGARPTAQVGKEGPVVIVGQQLAASLLQTPAIKASLGGEADKLKPTDLQLRIAQTEWKLDFSMASSDYALTYLIDVSVYQKEADTLYFKDTCQGSAAEKRLKDDWEKDDFAAVAGAALAAGNSCARQVLAALGLQPAKEPVSPAGQAAAQPAAESGAQAPTPMGTDEEPAPVPAIASPLTSMPVDPAHGSLQTAAEAPQ